MVEGRGCGGGQGFVVANGNGMALGSGFMVGKGDGGVDAWGGKGWPRGEVGRVLNLWWWGVCGGRFL